MIKLKAFLIHFSGSAIILGAFLSIVFFFWYPSPYFELEGVSSLITLLILSVLIAGPLLTGVVYQPGKKGMLFDIIVIIIVQIIFLGYGMHTIYNERPQYIVFNEGWFYVVQASAIDQNKLQNEVLNNSFFASPKLVFNLVPSDPKEKLTIVKAMFSGGKEMHHHAEFYRSYNHYISEITTTKQQTLSKIKKKYPSTLKTINKLEIKENINHQQFIYFQIEGKKEKGIMVLNKRSALPLGVIY
ncbi:MAG: hypothetical protein KZQ83_11940 [gamma proteobacterium symbiont of Taylorina sp.]|nr:hypothetical protein [gamma proteobacterium symbiont of Taylorina sp.]